MPLFINPQQKNLLGVGDFWRNLRNLKYLLWRLKYSTFKCFFNLVIHASAIAPEIRLGKIELRRKRQLKIILKTTIIEM